MRQILLDTETTGLDPKDGHRIIEIGCVEIIDRRFTGHDYHQYIQPERAIDKEAQAVHGITQEFLADKPRMSEIVHDFIDYIRGAELIIHNAPFDTGFLDHEFSLLDQSLGCISEMCSVIDTLKMAKKLFPGQRVNLNALCKRYEIDNSARDLHGALLDARLLADVYLTMTGGQVSLLAADETEMITIDKTIKRVSYSGELRVINPDSEEQAQHLKMLENMEKDCDPIVWH